MTPTKAFTRSRRRFLTHSGAVLTGLPLASSGVLAVNTAPKKIRIGVVGGGFGTSFQWHEHPDCVVEAVSDLRPERRERLMRTYMMAETTYYQQPTISSRRFQAQGKFGEIYYCEAEYQHAGLESLYFENGRRTWRHGIAPMHYPTHCTAFLTGVTGERLTEVVCHGWGDDDPICQDNVYNNPFWNESAMFKTDRGHAFRCNVWWKGAHRGTERAQWIGNRMSFYCGRPNGLGPVIVRSAEGRREKDDAGFVRDLPELERYAQPEWWKTDMLPEPLRHNSGHHGSHTFLTHEFVDALAHNRRPTVDLYEALAYTVPGIIAHESALRGGELMKVPQYDRPAGSTRARSPGQA